jgi:hypothetical protein
MALIYGISETKRENIVRSNQAALLLGGLFFLPLFVIQPILDPGNFEMKCIGKN